MCHLNLGLPKSNASQLSYRRVWMIRYNRIILVFGVLWCVGCATTEKQWKQAHDRGTIGVYEGFLAEHLDSQHPDLEYAVLAWTRTLELRWQEAESVGTIEEFESFIDYLSRMSRSRPIQWSYPFTYLENASRLEADYTSRSLRQIVELRMQEARASNNIESFHDFGHSIDRYESYLDILDIISDYQLINNHKSLIDTYRWNHVNLFNTVIRYRSFIRNYPESDYIIQAQANIEALISASLRALSVSILESAQLDEIRFPTGDIRMRGESFEPIYNTEKPAEGNIYLSLKLKLTSAGEEFVLDKEEVMFASADSNYTPFTWFEDLGLIVRRGERINIDAETTINLTVEVPSDQVERLHLVVMGEDIGSLADLGMRGED